MKDKVANLCVLRLFLTLFCVYILPFVSLRLIILACKFCPLGARCNATLVILIHWLMANISGASLIIIPQEEHCNESSSKIYDQKERNEVSIIMGSFGQNYYVISSFMRFADLPLKVDVLI